MEKGITNKIISISLQKTQRTISKPLTVNIRVDARWLHP